MKPVTKEIEQDLKEIRPFLRKLTKATNKYYKNKVLSDASDSELSTLMHVLHFIANGEITLSKNKQDKLIKGKKMPHLAKRFKSDDELEKLLKLNKKQKLKLLRNVGHYGEICI